MKGIVSVLVALVLVLGQAVSVVAQGNANVTFKLTLRGELQNQPAFAVFYASGRTPARHFHIYCGQADVPIKAPECSSTTYTWTQSVPVGTHLVYAYLMDKHKADPTEPGNAQYFGEGERTIQGDTTISASYTAGQTWPMVTKTFKLTLNGKVPASSLFITSIGPFPDDFSGPQAPPVDVFLCGHPGDQGGSAPGCVGDGRVYTATVQVPRGATRVIQWLTIDSQSQAPPKVFYQRTETLNANATNTAWYSYEPRMPSTGGGGTASSFLVNGLLLALGLVAAGGYTIRRLAR